MTPEHIMQTRFPTRKNFFVLNRLKNNRGCFLWVSSGEGDDRLRGLNRGEAAKVRVFPTRKNCLFS
jgi:hypothetical protein